MSTFNLDLAGACEKIMLQASDYAKQNYAGPGGLGRSNGALDFITSPSNGGIKFEVNNTGGGKKIRKARVLYKQRTKPSEVLSGADAKASGVCDTPISADEKEVTVDITGAVKTQPRAFSNAKMVVVCQDTQAFVNEFLMSDMRAMRENLNEQILALIAADTGKNIHQDGSTPTNAGAWKSKKLIAADSFGQSIPLTGNYNDVLMDYQNMQFSGVPALIGQGLLQQYFTLAGLACCNATTPYGDALSRAGAAYFLDQSANSVLGASNRFVMAAFGISHLLWFNENNNININTGVAQHIVVPDPVYPQIKWDLDFKWDECDKQWIYQLGAYFDVFNLMQADSFNTDATSPYDADELSGVTGIWGYLATNS